MLRPAGPKPHFLIGNIQLEGQGTLDTFRKWASQYGDILYTTRQKNLDLARRSRNRLPRLRDCEVRLTAPKEDSSAVAPLTR